MCKNKMFVCLCMYMYCIFHVIISYASLRTEESDLILNR